MLFLFILHDFDLCHCRLYAGGVSVPFVGGHFLSAIRYRTSLKIYLSPKRAETHTWRSKAIALHLFMCGTALGIVKDIHSSTSRLVLSEIILLRQHEIDTVEEVCIS